MSVAYATSYTSRNWRRVSQRELCPICQHPDWCRIFDDGGVHCMRVGDGGTPCSCGGRMHWPGGRPDNWQDRIASLPPPPPRPVADPALVDRTYRELLARCPLSDEHRASFHVRGETEESIARHGYGTLPNVKRLWPEIAAVTEAAVGRPLAGFVPGFVVVDGRLTFAPAQGGILIPVIDELGRIGGLRVRIDNAEKNKYRWFSGGDFPGSIGQDGHAVHVATPSNLAPDVTDTLFIVEGEITANIVADRLCHRVLSVPGVASLNNVMPTISAIGGITTVIIAFDKDTNPKAVKHVALAETRLAQQLAAAGYDVMQAKWSTSAGKGLDDILTSSPPTMAVARTHPALAQANPANDQAAADLAKLRRLHSLTVQATRSPNLGPERNTLAALATVVSGAEEGEWLNLTYKKLGDHAGVPERTAKRHLEMVGIRPLAAEAGIFDGVAEFALREVPERINLATGEIHPGYKSMHVRRFAPIETLLERVIHAPEPEKGKRNNHGGKRESCPKCGSSDVKRIITDECAACGELLRKPDVRIITSDEADGTPPCQDDIQGTDVDFSSLTNKLPSVSVLKGAKLTPTPQGGHDSRDRVLNIRDKLTAGARAIRASGDDFFVPESEYGSIVPLFATPPPEANECLGCGALISPEARHCLDCDPRGA
jgi:hypothetical protein